MKAIFLAGGLCGILDILAAFVFYPPKPKRLLQGIAAAVLGKDAFAGGDLTVALGLALHFVIAFGAATVYYLASRRWRWLLDQPLLWGAIYGIAVYAVMNLIVVPLSAIGWRPFTWKGTLIGLAVHIVFVGMPMVYTIRRHS